ncbi:MAG TPA: tetratricopeptide repeat protein [Candidatus Obscuribacterales bacterium]
MNSDLSSAVAGYRAALKALQQGRLEAAIAMGLALYRAHPAWAGSHKLLGILNLKQGKPAQAEAAWRKTLALDPGDTATLFNLLQLLRRQKDPDPEPALALCQQYLSQARPDAGLYALATEIYLGQGLLAEARELSARLCELEPSPASALRLAQAFDSQDADIAVGWYGRVLEREPEHPAALEGLGGLCFKAGEMSVALSCYEKLVALAPSARRWNNLGAVQLALGLKQDARGSYEQALALAPELVPAHDQLASLLLEQAEFAAALPHLRACLHQVAGLGRRLLDTAVHLSKIRELALAEDYLALCCEIPEQTGQPVARLYGLRAQCARELMHDGQQAVMFMLARSHAPDPLIYECEELFALPYVYNSHEHLDEARQAFTRGLERLEGRLAQIQGSPDPELLQMIQYPFLLAYQGRNDRALVSQLGRCWTGLLRAAGRLQHCRHQPQPGRRIRVGFVSGFFHNHAVTACYGQMIAELAADPDFEVSCLSLQAFSDAKTDWLRAQVQHFLPAPVSAADILALELDVLAYCDIGMDRRSYQLALHRLAPIQCVLAGHPVTTGLPEIDYFLSNARMEIETADEHYSEKLLCLPEGYACYQRIPRPERVLSRLDLGLDESRHLYFCPSTLQKLHPDFDAVLGLILCADPLAEVLLVRQPQTPMHEPLQQRLARSLPDVAERIRFLPWMDHTGFCSLVSQADAILDSFPFGGGTTARIVLSLDQPYLTWPGEFLYGRMPLGHYRRMGCVAPIATSAEDYAALAVRLASDRDYRAYLQQEIRTHKEALFASPTFSLAQTLIQMVESWPEKVNSFRVKRGEEGARDDGLGASRE